MRLTGSTTICALLVLSAFSTASQAARYVPTMDDVARRAADSSKPAPRPAPGGSEIVVRI